MMDKDNFLTPRELRRIADLCESLDPVWEDMMVETLISVEGDLDFKVRDANGDLIGKVSWSVDGAVFYPWGGPDGINP